MIRIQAVMRFAFFNKAKSRLYLANQYFYKINKDLFTNN